MKLKLNDYYTKILLTYPEHGMGYQRVDVLLKSNEIIENVMVLNSEILIFSDKYSNIKLQDIENLILKKRK